MATSERDVLIPYPKDDANKYSRGKLVVVAGSARYPGAACLAAKAGARTGAGYTMVYTDAANVALVQGYLASLVVANWESFAPDAHAVMAKAQAKPQVKPQACVIGCGFDPADTATHDVLQAALELPYPIVVDGGALTLCTQDAIRDRLAKRAGNGWLTVLTPHAGEAARLADAAGLVAAGLDAAIADDPAAAATALSEAYASLTVLKGPVTAIAYGGEARLMDEGTSALAKAGTGDVLAGMLGALFAQQEPGDLSVRAACDLAYSGVVLHAHAGRIAAEQKTAVSVLAEDVIEVIPLAIQAIGRKKAE